MEIEDQVCSLEHAKRLKGLGIQQDSYFIWANENLIPRCSIHGLDKNELFEPRLCAAFTVAELGRMLPFTIKMNEYQKIKFNKPKTFYLNANLGYVENDYSPAIQYNFYYYDDVDEYDAVEMVVGPNFSNPNEANSRAEMLIYLLENNLLNYSNSKPLKESHD